jgi:hypothetical protein
MERLGVRRRLLVEGGEQERIKLTTKTDFPLM